MSCFLLASHAQGNRVTRQPGRRVASYHASGQYLAEIPASIWASGLENALGGLYSVPRPRGATPTLGQACYTPARGIPDWLQTTFSSLKGVFSSVQASALFEQGVSELQM